MRKRMLIAVLAGMLVIAFFAYRDLRSGIHSGVPMRDYVGQIEVEPGTAGMIEALDKVSQYREGSKLRRFYRDMLTEWSILRGANSVTSARDLLRIGQSILVQGDTEKAIEIFENIRSYADENPLPQDAARDLADMRAIAYLRLGEQQNCLNNPYASACIIPLDSKAIHQLREGSTKAAKIYEEELLKKNPDDYSSKWLLNIAHMTLGQYPGGVPASHLLPMPGVAENYEGPKYSNIADRIGVGDKTVAGSVVVEDFNGDDLLDIFATEWGPYGGLKLYFRRSDGGFDDVTEKAGLSSLAGGLNAIHADYDNDGFADIYVMRGAWRKRRGHIPNSLLRNNGDGTFTDATAAAGILDFNPTITSGFADLNNDGWLDLVVANESNQKQAKGNISQVFISNQDGTFTDRARQTGFAPDCGAKGLAIGDRDNDGDVDIFVSCYGAENYLFDNRFDAVTGKLTFADISLESGSRLPLDSFSAWFWDYDNDGREDLFVGGYGHSANAREGAMGGSPFDGSSTDIMARSYVGQKIAFSNSALYRNTGSGAFSAEAAAAGLDTPFFAMGSNFGDFDNDGWLDIYLGTGAPSYQSVYPNAALQNMGGTRFRDISGSSGLGHIQKGHGIAFGDFDFDGDQDIFAEMGGGFRGDPFQNALFENLGSQNKWINLFLVGTKSNRSAIGARIRVDISGGGNRSIYRTVSSGSSFGSNPLRQEIGLGKAGRIDRVTVTWPTSGIVQIFDDLDLDSAYRVTEGEGQPKKMALKPLPFKPTKNAAHKHH